MILMTIVNPALKIKEYYESPKYNDCDCFHNKCNENRCEVVGATNRSFIILNGDEIKIPHDPNEDSADCIFIKHNFENEKIKIIIVELKSSRCKLDKLKRKFQYTGSRILDTFKERGLDEPILKFVFLGKLESHARKVKNYNLIRVKSKLKTFKVKNCGVHINELF